MIQRALEGLRVLDLTHYIAGPYCTKLLADYGADVVKIERPGGDGARNLGPFPNDTRDPEKSGIFLHLNTNKRGIVLDLKSTEGVETFKNLVRSADVVVENFHPRVLPSLGLSYQTLRSLKPSLIMTSITDFGQTGPYRDYRGSEIVDYALGGPFLVGGLPDHHPVKIGGSVIQYLAGLHGAGATIVALLGREAHGQGDHVDISIMETQAGSPDRRTPMLVGYQYTGNVNKRGTVSASPIRPCKDGYINVYVVATRLAQAFDMMDRPDLKDDPRFSTPTAAMQPESQEALEEIVIGWLLERTMVEVWNAAQKNNVLCGPLYNVADLLKDQHFRARKFWEEIDHARAGRLTYPGLPFSTPNAERLPRRPAPLLGEHTQEVLQELLAAPDGTANSPAPSAAETPNRLPLEGMRVIDLTVVLAGTNATTLLADWGAEVIRVEPIALFQPMTRGAIARTTQGMIDAVRNWVVAYPDWTPGERPWNRWPFFNAHARNKHSMTLNLGRPGAREVFERLVRTADIVVENNVPETIEKLGITYEDLRKIKPDIVMLRMPAYGLSGPYKNYRSLGAHLEGTAGHYLVRGYPDTDPSMTEDVYFGDACAGAGGAAAAAMAWFQTRRTGKGQVVEFSQTENLIPFFGEFLLDYQMNGRIAEQPGNDLYRMAPHNAYACRGEDRWVAIAVGADREWQGLQRAMGNPAWTNEERFATKSHRYQHRRELDELVSRWTADKDNRWVMETLQKEGVPAGVLNDERDAFADPHLNARGFFQELTNDDCGTHRYPGIIWKMANTPNSVRMPPCRLGEHNDYVYKDLLAVSHSEYALLEKTGHIGTGYPPSVP